MSAHAMDHSLSQAGLRRCSTVRLIGRSLPGLPQRTPAAFTGPPMVASVASIVTMPIMLMMETWWG